MRSFATKPDLSLYQRMDYCYQTLLNFQERYDTKALGDDRDWLVTWAKYVRETCLYGMANGMPGQWNVLYWNVMLIEARHMVIDSYLLYLERKREQQAKFYEPRREIFMRFGLIQSMQDLVDDKLDSRIFLDFL